MREKKQRELEGVNEALKSDEMVGVEEDDSIESVFVEIICKN